ncbi:ENV1 protein, partial [Turnix velox]|nr:ENV1 protein [Turnix velox]
VSQYSTLWKMLQATYGILNSTNSNPTKECWLCYNIRPPFYEAIGIIAPAKRVKGINPRECFWNKTKENTQGITLSEITGQGLCVG